MNDSLSLEESQKDNVPSPEQDDSALSKGPNNLQPQDPSSIKDDQLPSHEENLENDDAQTLNESKENDPALPPDCPQGNEEILNTQDPLSPMDTSSADQSLKPMNNTEHSSEGDDQPPVLQRSVTGPASMLS